MSLTERAKRLYMLAMAHVYAPTNQPLWEELTWQHRRWWEFLAGGR